MRRGTPSTTLQARERAAHVQVHLVERADLEWWERHVAFRDWLREHPEDREVHAALKRELASRYRDDREAYMDAKGEFVARVLAKRAAAREGTGT